MASSCYYALTHRVSNWSRLPWLNSRGQPGGPGFLDRTVRQLLLGQLTLGAREPIADRLVVGPGPHPSLAADATSQLLRKHAEMSGTGRHG